MDEWTVGYLIGVLTGLFVGATTTIAVVNDRLKKAVSSVKEDEDERV